MAMCHVFLTSKGNCIYMWRVCVMWNCGFLLQVWICLWLYLSTDEIYSFFAKHFEIYFCLKFIREYTGKIDELIKDKIEAQNEEKGIAGIFSRIFDGNSFRFNN